MRESAAVRREVPKKRVARLVPAWLKPAFSLR
jgi:hypothetical protein